MDDAITSALDFSTASSQLMPLFNRQCKAIGMSKPTVKNIVKGSDDSKCGLKHYAMCLCGDPVLSNK